MVNPRGFGALVNSDLADCGDGTFVAAARSPTVVTLQPDANTRRVFKLSSNLPGGPALRRWPAGRIIGRPLTRWPRVWIRLGGMSDSLERLYQAIIAAKDLDPAISRTARLFQRGPAKMARKLAEEAIEVVIDAVNGKTDAVVRESADLLYNLTVLWASAGVRPEDVWREMERREDLLGIAEKMPKTPVKVPSSRLSRRPIVALEGRALRKRH